MTLVMQTAGEPSAVVASVRAIVAELDPSLPVYDVRTMDDHLRNGQAMLFTRIGQAFSSVFGLLALVLAMVGVYGVVSYTVAARTREIGVRVALGARLPAVLRLVIGQGVKLAWAGVALGLLLSLGATGALRSMLYGVAPRDPVVLSGVLVMLTAVAGVASLVPAWRATRIDPLTAIRAE
jgi:ABC-type antimicrobial peptide transport system permease subunit